MPVCLVSVSGTELPATVAVQSEPMTGVAVHTPTAGPGSGAPHPVCTVTVKCVESGAPGAPCQSGIVQPFVRTVLHPPGGVSLSVCVSVGPQVGGGTALPEPESPRQLPTPRPRGQEFPLQSVVSSAHRVFLSDESGVCFARMCMCGSQPSGGALQLPPSGETPTARAQRAAAGDISSCETGAAHGPASLLQQAPVTVVCDLLGGRREPGTAVPASAMVKETLGVEGVWVIPCG